MSGSSGTKACRLYGISKKICIAQMRLLVSEHLNCSSLMLRIVFYFGFIFLSGLFGCQKHRTSAYSLPLSARLPLSFNTTPPSSVKIGMSKEEVIAIEGIPHINPSTPNHWVYLKVHNNQDISFAVQFYNAKVVALTHSIASY